MAPHATTIAVRSELPPGALLQQYADAGAYTDCFATTTALDVPFADYVEAFYTGAAFRAERVVLALIGKGSNDADARRLAHDGAATFAAWSVEARMPDQILLRDFLGRTRSWLMVEPIEGGARLYFGSAVIPVGIGARERRLGFPFNALLGFHQIYSRVLLSGARGRLIKLHARASTNEPAQ